MHPLERARVHDERVVVGGAEALERLLLEVRLVAERAPDQHARAVADVSLHRGPVQGFEPELPERPREGGRDVVEAVDEGSVQIEDDAAHGSNLLAILKP